MAASKIKVSKAFGIGLEKPFYCKLLYPSSVGCLTAAALALSPTIVDKSEQFLEMLPSPVTKIPTPVILAAIGFPAGYLLTTAANWARWKTIKALLQYQGWIHGAKDMKTKLWAILLRLLKGPPPYDTYYFQRSLPKQPLPDLESTLDLWLKVAAELVSKEEFEQTKDAVEAFRKNEGPKLQKHLEKRYQEEVNWLSEYWMTVAYLGSRDPVAGNSNFFWVNKHPIEDLHQLDRAAGAIRIIMEFYELIDLNTFPPVQLQDLVPLCMNGYRYVFNTVRVPGEQIDRIQRYPGETHIIVIRNGYYYKVDMYTNEDGKKNKHRMLTAHEIKMQLERICQHADGLEKPLPVASLTSQNRTKWAKQREVLATKNAVTLKWVESALFIVSLEMEPAKDVDDHCRLSLTGRGGDRWFDKCFTTIFYPGGVYGCNVEHSGIDAMVLASLSEYMNVMENFGPNGLLPADKPNDDLPSPMCLTWVLDDLVDEIKTANEEFLKMADDMECANLNTSYGKRVMKMARLSPDGYIQMALQLAYYRLHKETPKTYEPATSRLYALGRTENIHPMSAESKAWVQSMLDPNATKQTREELLRKAVKVQTKARINSTIGRGCDRHLIGLYCASRELGMDVPAIFYDKAWQMPFKLSTSQTPTRAAEMGAKVDYNWVIGGFAPVCKTGYGLSYVIMGEDLINITVTAFNSCEETNARKLVQSIEQSLDEMKALLM